MNRYGSFTARREVQTCMDLSIPSNLRLGKTIFDNGEVEVKEFTNDKIVAITGGGQKRKVEFVSSFVGFTWSCTCKKNQEKFCKHAAALGFVIISE